MTDVSRIVLEPQWPELSGASQSILVDLLVHGPSSRAELARRSGLSRASLTRISKEMVDSGLLIENDAVSPTGTGRPSLPMDVNVDFAHLIGINLTATTLHLVRTDLRAKILDQISIPLRSTDPIAVTAAISETVAAQRLVDPAVMAVGISLAGPVSPHSEIIASSPFLGWTDVPLVRMVQDRTTLPTVVQNDVRALTAAEHWFGAAAGCRDFALITIGAGVGCGLVMDDRLVDGMSGASGQVGHLSVSDSGPACERGHRGCVRAYLASSSIVAQVQVALRRPDLDYDQVMQLAAEGDPVARRVVEDAGRALGVLIGSLAAIAAPEKVLISGEGVTLVPLVKDIIDAAAEAIQHWTVRRVPIQVAVFASTEWARGAAVMALRHQVESITQVRG